MTDNKKIPVHVSIIMDGNGRWANLRGLQRWDGHVEGVKSVRAVLRRAGSVGVKYLSLYAFSEENWNRSPEEVSALMQLMSESMLAEIANLDAENVRFVVLGNRSRLNDRLNRTIDECMSRTAGNTGITLIIFLSYSGKWDILQAVRKVLEDKTCKDVSFEDIDSHLVTAGYPDPDLIVRTSGELRISNYLLWQSAYSEFYFTDTLWPDFREEAFDEALASYASRERRYGKTK